MTRYTFTDHEGIIRTHLCHSLDRAHSHAFNFTFAQSRGNYTAARAAMLSVRSIPTEGTYATDEQIDHSFDAYR